MNTPTQKSCSTPGADGSTTGITIIYEDLATGLTAKRFSDLLWQSLGVTQQVTPACWRSELIRLPAIAAEMARDAVASEFVILSLRGDTVLSPAAKRWNQDWMKAAGGRSSLIALFDPGRSTGAAEEIRAYLRRASADAGVPFFAHYRVPSAEEVEFKPKCEEVEEPAHPRESSPRSVKLMASYFPALLSA
jgi:hypothetical protein